MKKIKYWLAAVALLLPFTPLAVFAAYNDVTTDGTANIVLPGNSLSYNILSTSKAVYYKVNNDGSSIDLSMDNGSQVEITSADKSSFTITNYGTCSISTSCGGQSYMYVSCTAAQVVTVTMGAANTCSGGSTGGSTSGGGGGGGGGGGAAATTPAAKTPAATTPTATTPSTPVAVAVTTPAPVVVQPAVVEEKPESSITFSNVPSAGLQPGEKMSFGYEYKHAGATMNVKIVRQILNSQGKAVKTATIVKKLANEQKFAGAPTETILPSWARGEYSMRVQAFNVRNLKTALAENSFSFTVGRGEAVEEKKPVEESETGTITFSNVPSAGLQPGEKMSFGYEYKHAGATMNVKIVRQILNSQGKAVKTATIVKKLANEQKFAGAPTETILPSWAPGEYAMRMRALDKNGKVMVENSFSFVVEKLKQKKFIKGDVTDPSSALSIDAAGVEQIKTDVSLPVLFRLPYSYTNETDKTQTIRMVREVVDSAGKVKTSSVGRWVMAPGEKDKSNPLQAIPNSLTVGEYQIKVRALDFKTKEVLAENSLRFSIELR